MVTWDTRKLTDCGDVLQGLTYSPDNVKPYGLLVLRSSNIQNEVLSFNDCVFVDCDVEDRKLVKKDDILICVRNGSSDLIGKCALIDKDYMATFGAFMSVLRSDMADYLFQLFRSEVVQKQIRGNSNATINQITKRDFEEIIVPIPPLQERLHIAEALSDTDALLTAMEKLIAKKRAIKQGAMQELLTGKRRLPGFEGEWVERKLSEIAPIIMGQSPDSLYYNNFSEGLPLIQGNADIENRLTITRFYTSKITKLANRGNIIMTVRAPVGEVAKASFDCCLGRGVCAIKGSEFLYHYLVFIEPTWSTLSTGSTFDSINSKSLYETIVYCPSDTIEQTAIAEILSDMDEEIDTLTVKLDKLRHIKQGMMSELLSGRIRLIDQEQVS